LADALAIALAAACVLLLAETAHFLRNLSHLHRLDRLAAQPPETWPSVSIVMAARDEADDVAEAVRSRLEDDYPDLQVILVDDRSTDGTGEAAIRAADGDPRFTLVRVDDLPDGWLGKVHAMTRGVERATGEWLLLSDGDVIVEPGTLRASVAHCESAGVDLMALVPSFVAGSFLIDGVWVVFMRGLIVMADPAKVRDPGSRVALGAGAFNLVRRSAYDATEGLEHLRMETGDDVALASMVKRAGGRLDLVDGAGHARVAIYRSVGELVRGIEKNGSTTATIPFPLFVLLFVVLGAVLFAPFVAIVVGPAWLRGIGAATLLIYSASEMYGLWRNTRMWAPAVVWPIGYLIMAVGMIRSTWLAHRNGGVYWRGTFYPLDELHSGRRFTI
jgi:cellulose synthase/poly-beta-1,6-N-acetylglucosamine synthase-like glycosyltransferase